MNLAPIKYARVLSADGGPIDRIASGPLRNRRGEWHQAVATLSPHLNLRKPTVEVFGEADGTGTDRSPMLARFKAVSEALERWALYFLLQCRETERYGLDVDPSSNGMAAYPGLFGFGARRRARAEAAERYTLAAWWEGRLDGRTLEADEEGTHLVQLDNPVSAETVVIVWRRDRHGLYAYGFAADTSLKRAQMRATIEMERSAAAMGAFLTRNPKFGSSDLARIQNWQERRILYFALPEGHEAFQRRLASKRTTKGEARRLKPLIDTELQGPWTRYATVWRTLYPMPGKAYLDPAQNFFFW